MKIQLQYALVNRFWFRGSTYGDIADPPLEDAISECVDPLDLDPSAAPDDHILRCLPIANESTL